MFTVLSLAARRIPPKKASALAEKARRSIPISRTDDGNPFGAALSISVGGASRRGMVWQPSRNATKTSKQRSPSAIRRISLAETN